MNGITVLGTVVEGAYGEPDLTLDALPISELARDASGEGVPLSIYSAPWVDQRAFLLSLLGEGPSVTGRMLPGRIAVMCCALCGDASCGILFGAELVRGADVVLWKDAQWEAETFRPVPPPRTPISRAARRLGLTVSEEFAGWRPNGVGVRTITFDRGRYDGVVREELLRLDAG